MMRLCFMRQLFYQGRPPGPPDDPEYVDRVTELPLLYDPFLLAYPSKYVVPPLTVIPDLRVGVSEPETISELPAALEWVLNAYVSDPTVNPYQIPLVNDDAL